MMGRHNKGPNGTAVVGPLGVHTHVSGYIFKLIGHESQTK